MSFDSSFQTTHSQNRWKSIWWGDRNSNQKGGCTPFRTKFRKHLSTFIENAKTASLTDTFEFDFNGNGFVIWGQHLLHKKYYPDYINRVSTRHIGSEVFGLAEPNHDLTLLKWKYGLTENWTM